MSEPKKCCGECVNAADGHIGEVKTVHVTGGKGWGSDYDWGHFDYCEQAIAIDCAKGFHVREVREPGVDSKEGK